MKNIFNQKVFYSDTDSYGVVWHGSYLRWLEMGRVLFCEQKGYKLSELEEKDIVLPVFELNIKYKQSAHLEDILTIETEIVDCSKFSLTFKQIILESKSRKILVEAIVKVVAINKQGKLYRTLPRELVEISLAS